ncbi:DUF4974 domain-containing protein [Fulvimarina endophytica]|uniref:DUF4974 domain-containing protein n=2 Tax=Fulvimarina endophytica TaxID=2293836 RepID=A0A371XBA4_9HYPH|nr:DUF4974 domain-containing protein [Fulvimarina endophytica]
MRLQDDRDPETFAQFEAWRRSDPRCEDAYARLSAMHGMEALRRASESDARRLGSSVPAPVLAFDDRRRAKPRSWRPAMAGLAAVLLVMIGWQYGPEAVLRWQSDYMTAAGQRDTITLPDGSTVAINTSTAIALDFSDGRRHVSLLEGEAFFDVVHDPAHPFVVDGPFAEVEVLGTAFGVRTDSERDTVVLERGSVLVSRRGEDALLEPGQMIMASAAGLSAVASADLDQSLAWRDGRIVFRDRPFAAALDDLERYYGGRVMLMTDRASGRLVSGHYRIDDPDIAIRTLARSVGIDVTRFPGGILILR